MISTLDRRLARRIDALFADCADGPGCAVGVQRGGERLFAAGYGLANVEHRVPIDEGTAFRIASVSKQFTVTAVLRLAARGRLRLDDDVRGLVAELAGLPQRVTLDQLMRNTSGLPDFLELLRLGGLGLEGRCDRPTMLRTIARCRHLNFAPGSRFLYCNSNFLLLGVVVERLAGRPLGEFLRAEVFAPLGMDNTALATATDSVVPRLATPYLRDADGTLRRATHGFEHGGEGGLVSNVPDLLSWTAELLQPTRLAEGLLASLTQPTRLANGSPSPYARGLEHSRVLGLDCVGHGGLWPGYRTELLIAPREALSVVVISNDGSRNPYQLARQVVEALQAPAPTAVPVAAQSPSPSPSPLAAFSGPWLCADVPALFELSLVRGEPVVTQWGAAFGLQAQPDGRWLPWRGAYEFALRVGDGGSLEVELGAGQVARFARLDARSAPDPALAGRYGCAEIGVTWEIVAPSDAGDAWLVHVLGPLQRAPAAWPLGGIHDDLLEIETPGSWLRSTQLARIERDRAGRIAALSVFSSRIRGLRFERLTEAVPARTG